MRSLAGWDPETEITRRPHIRVREVDLPPGVLSAIWRWPGLTLICLQRGLCNAERRLALTEQLIRDELGVHHDWLDVPEAQRLAEQRSIRALAAKRLVPTAVVDQICTRARHRHVSLAWWASLLDVPTPLLKERIEQRLEEIEQLASGVRALVRPLRRPGSCVPRQRHHRRIQQCS